MNGMGNRDLFDLGSNVVSERITSLGIVFSGDGQIELKGKGNIVFDDIIGGDIKEFLESKFNEKGFEIEFEKD